MAEKRVINLEIKDNSASLKKQFSEAKKELQEMAAAYGENSEQAIKAARNAARLKDIIDDSGQAIKNLQGGGSFQALATSLSSVASGFAAVQGAVNLLGVESKDVEKALLKVQSAMALAEGLRGLEDAGRSFGALKATVVGAFKSMSTAGKAFAATGIGLIITGIALAIAYSDDLKKAFGGISEQQKTMNQVANASVEIAAKELNAIDKLKIVIADESKSRKEKNQAVRDLQKEYPDLLKNVDAEKSTLEQLNTAIALNVKLIKAKAQLEAIGAIRADEYKKQLEERVKMQTGENVGILDQAQANLENAKWTESVGIAVTDKEEIVKRARAAQKIANQDSYKEIALSKQKVKFLDEEAKASEAVVNQTLKALGQDSEAEALREKMAKEREAAEQRAKQAIADRLAALAALRKFEQGIEDDRLSEYDREVIELKRKYDEQFSIARKYNQDITTLQQGFNDELEKINQKRREQDKALTDEVSQAIIDADKQRLDHKTQQSDLLRSLNNTELQNEIDALVKLYEAKFELAKGNDELEKALRKQQLEDIAKINSDFRKKESENEDAETAKKKLRWSQQLEIASYTLSTISSLTELFAGKSLEAQKRAFQIQKASQIAQTLIDTYRSATGAFSALAPISVVGPALGIAAAAAAVTAGLANVKRIASTKFEGGQSAGASSAGQSMTSVGSSTTTASSTTPVFNITGGQDNQLKDIMVKSYVVGSDVTSQQELDRKRIATSSW